MVDVSQTSLVALATSADESPRELVIKGVDRIEAIIFPWQDERRVAELYTHTFSRVMRRDFNLTSVKLFWFTKQGQQRFLVQSLLRDLSDEAAALEDLAHRFEMPREAATVSCTMRIISNEADVLFDALIKADRALHKINHSPLAEMAEETVIPFFRAFNVVRRRVFGFPKADSAEA